MSEKVLTHTNYKALAWIYDKVMEEVDYEVWGNFIDTIIQEHNPEAHDILELGCGTASLSLSLDELMCYNILATDKSSEMIEVARRKARQLPTNQIAFKKVDFLDLSPLRPEKFDAVLLTFDSINYLHETSEILTLFDEVHSILSPKGIFVFDFTTPQNSREAVYSLNGEEGSFQNYYYHRTSRYNEEEQIHKNIFTIQRRDPDTDEVLESFQEQHEQRIYSLDEMQQLVQQSDLEILAKYEGFDLVDAGNDSLRITMTLQCQQTP